MASSDDIIAADNLGRRRARMLPVVAVIFLTQQIAFFSNPPAERAVDHVRIGAWVLLTAVILLMLTTGGWWFRSTAIRAALDDERTRANRSSAMHWGFVTTMLVAVAIYATLGVTAFTARESIHLLVSAGIVVALMRFGRLERRDYA